MKDHYRLTDTAYRGLKAAFVTDLDLIKALQWFDPHNTGEPLGLINLLHFIDKKGDFINGLENKNRKIAKALFESLDLNTQDKLMIFKYIEDYNEGEL